MLSLIKVKLLFVRYGPHFEDVQREGSPKNITVQAGGSVYLNCRISLLQDKTVSLLSRIILVFLNFIKWI